MILDVCMLIFLHVKWNYTIHGNIWRNKILANTHFLNFWMVSIGEITFASYLDGKTKKFGE